MQVVPDTPLGRERLELIAEVGRALADSHDVDQVLRTAAGALLRSMADLAVLVADSGDQGVRLEVSHLGQSQAGFRERIESDLGILQRLAANEMRRGRGFQWIPSLNAHTARFAARNSPRVLHLLEALRVQSLIVVPLRTEGRIIGALALARTTPDLPYVAADLAAAQVLARRIAVAVETARLRTAMGQAAHRHSRLEETLQKWNQVFELAGWGVAVVDGTDRRIDMVNPAFAFMHGYSSPEELTGHLFDDLSAAKGGEIEQWGPGSVGSGTSYQSLHVRVNGGSFPVLVNVTPLGLEGEDGSFVVTVQDISDLKRAEERLRRAQRMEAVGRLAGGVAHEVNNMMTIILGFSDLLNRAPELPAALRRDVEEIRKAANRAGKITQQLLAFSRQQVLQPADLNINSVVEDLIPVLRLLLPANVRVDTDLARGDTTVRADRAQLEQVLINLAFNARDAMPGGGTIRITSEARDLDEETGRRLIGIPFPPGRYGLLSVVDTGHGMDPAILAQVFEPFFTTKPVGAGTGLGLATVYGIVKQSAGFVWVESTPGGGTTFTVALPVADAVVPADTAVAEPARAEPERGGVVLVVEDEDGVRELAGRILTSRRYQVLEARNGSEALAVLDRHGQEVDLVLTDVVVPDVATDELERRLRELRPDLPILYMSGYARDDVLQRSLIRQEDPFLQKPFTAEELMELVRRTLRDPVVG